MFAKPIGPNRTTGLDGEDLCRDRVVVLRDRRVCRPSNPGAPILHEQAPAAIHCFGVQFRPADHAALTAWSTDPGHGYDRFDVERSLSDDGSWERYALIYAPGHPWSILGVMRRGDDVEAWLCATGKTIGRHRRMTELLAALPHAGNYRKHRVR